MNVRTCFVMVAALALGSACSNSDTTPNTPITVDVPRPDVSSNDAAADTVSDVATDTATDTASPDVAADVAADASPDAGADASADAATDGGMYVDGCFVGTPVLMTDFLNRCTTAVGAPSRAPRGARLTADGGVQPLPM